MASINHENIFMIQHILQHRKLQEFFEFFSSGLNFKYNECVDDFWKMLDWITSYIVNYPYYFQYNIHDKCIFLNIIHSKLSAYPEIFQDVKNSSLSELVQKYPFLHATAVDWLNTLSLIIILLLGVILLFGTMDIAGSLTILDDHKTHQVIATTQDKTPLKKDDVTKGPLPKQVAPNTPISLRISQLQQHVSTPLAENSKKTAAQSLFDEVPDLQDDSTKETDANTPKTVLSTLTSNQSEAEISHSGGSKTHDWSNVSQRSTPYSSSHNRTEEPSSSAATLYHELRTDTMQEAVTNPSILIGWKIFIEDYGTGIILAIERRKFHTTRFIVEFMNDKILTLPLKRGSKKGSIPFRLLEKVSLSKQ